MMKNIYQNRLKYFYFIHLIVLIFVGLTGGIFMVLKKNLIDPPENYLVAKADLKQIDSLFFQNSTNNSVLEIGFFAPNLRSRQVLFFETCDETFGLEYTTHEGKMRSNSLVNNTIRLMQKEVEEGETQYYDLLLQNLASTIKEVNILPSSCKEVKVSYKILEFPSLRNKLDIKKPELKTLKDWYYETK